MLRRPSTSGFPIQIVTLIRRLPTMAFGPVACFALLSCSATPSQTIPQPVVAPPPSGAGLTTAATLGCPAAREFIATEKFLSGQPKYHLEAKEVEAIAGQVSSGCSGAAQRFASTVQLLTVSGLGLNNAIETGIELANQNDTVARGFRGVFSRCFLKEHLDLDLLNCLKVAKWLSLSGEGEVQPDNFVKAVTFCTQGTPIKLSHSRCAKLAIRLARVPFNSPHYSAAKTFEQMVVYLTGESGPKVGSGQALKLAEFLATYSPSSADNYKVAYEFAKKSRNVRRAHHFALGLAKKLPKTPGTMVAE